MATTKRTYTKKTTTTSKDNTPEEKEEITYDEPVPTTELLDLEILRSMTCDSEVA